VPPKHTPFRLGWTTSASARLAEAAARQARLAEAAARQAKPWRDGPPERDSLLI